MKIAHSDVTRAKSIMNFGELRIDRFRFKRKNEFERTCFVACFFVVHTLANEFLKISSLTVT